MSSGGCQASDRVVSVTRERSFYRKQPAVIIIAAMGTNRVIGSGNGMPWNVPEEYQHFVTSTRGQIIIIGRRSYEIFGPDLQCSDCYVVTRSQSDFPSAKTASSLEAAISLAQQNQAGRKIYIAGGASIYQQALPLVEAMHLSYIKGQFDGDSFFPEFNKADWLIARDEDRGTYRYVEYVRP